MTTKNFALSCVVGGLSCALFLVPLLGASAQGPCHVLTSHRPPPAGFAAAYNLFSGLREVVLSAVCTGNGILITAGSEANTQYIYKTGYLWNRETESWDALSFVGAEPHQEDWFIGKAQTTVPRTRVELAQNNFVLAYMCTWVPRVGRYMCGCSDTLCRESKWLLQVFRVQGAGTGSVAPPREDAAP